MRFTNQGDFLLTTGVQDTEIVKQKDINDPDSKWIQADLNKLKNYAGRIEFDTAANFVMESLASDDDKNDFCVFTTNDTVQMDAFFGESNISLGRKDDGSDTQYLEACSENINLTSKKLNEAGDDFYVGSEIMMDQDNITLSVTILTLLYKEIGFKDNFSVTCFSFFIP